MKNVVVVGAGMSGLTATAYLLKMGHQVTLIEQGDKLGGLVSSFNYKGFTVDGGARSIENNGVLFPMLKHLGIDDIEWKKSIVSLGLEDEFVILHSKDNIDDYQNLLVRKFPEEKEAISHIFNDIKKFMDYMDILYGIDNPLFLDIKEDRDYFIKKIFPWLFKFLRTIGKIKKYDTPIKPHLNQYTNNQELIDIISQHFFQQTPVLFALSYFSIYLDYYYPKGGTGVVVEKIGEYIKKHGADIHLNTRVSEVRMDTQTVYDSEGREYHYDYLVWAADQKALYRQLNIEHIPHPKEKKLIEDRRTYLEDKKGGDSVLSLYLLTNIDSQNYPKSYTPHLFYTPSSTHSYDLTKFIRHADGRDKETMISALKEYLEYTTYEISIPSNRYPELSPKGKSAIIVSTLMDYEIMTQIRNGGWYDEFKSVVTEKIIEVLNKTLFKGFKDQIFDSFIASPLTVENRVKSTDGAITGWAFTNDTNPSVNEIPKVAKSVLTGLTNIVQAGQWAYSPAGIPTAVMTGKLAADRVLKKLRKK
ncbi:MAG: phytoene desaturase family protein [Candidatus Izemoplasmatales bacterium]